MVLLFFSIYFWLLVALACVSLLLYGSSNSCDVALFYLRRF